MHMKFIAIVLYCVFVFIVGDLMPDNIPRLILDLWYFVGGVVYIIIVDWTDWLGAR